MHNNINVNVSGPVQPTSQYKTVVLKGNLPFVSQVTEPNMKYVIKHNFDLGSESVTIPAGCILEFDGGSLSNGSIIGNDTVILSINLNSIPLDNVTMSGTLKQLATVAVTGNYNDLNNKPSIPAAQVQSDWNITDSASKAYIKNKPTIPTIPENNATWNGGESFPANPTVGEMFLYTPTGGTSIPVWWNGTAWVDATGATV